MRRHGETNLLAEIVFVQIRRSSDRTVQTCERQSGTKGQPVGRISAVEKFGEIRNAVLIVISGAGTVGNAAEILDLPPIGDSVSVGVEVEPCIAAGDRTKSVAHDDTVSSKATCCK